jgi:glutamate-1-semialdehyde 2,1-aminomutase
MAVETPKATTSIGADYHARHPRSQELYDQALAHFPSGVTHDARWMEPFPLAIAHAAGAYKWDVDGHRLIDYWQGHGALLLGHAHPAVVQAVQSQVARGTHYGANHELEIRWAEQVKRCFPQIEQMRFTASGTEATLLALRLARAFTGRPTILRLAGHFHGWHDLLAVGAEADTAVPTGLPAGIVESTVVVDATLEAIERTCATRDDIAAVILEPSGASYGKQPLPPSFLRDLRTLCTQRKILLICDEVVTGFRVAPGGTQQQAEVQADLTSLAKILAGGLPGGAVGGRGDILRHIAFGDASWNSSQKIRHQGTFNGNPLAAAAGIATLDLAQTGAPQARAAELAGMLRDGFNAALRERNRQGCAAYGESSIVHLLLDSSRSFAPGELPDDLPLAELKAGLPARLRQSFRLAMLNHGVDLMRGTSAFVSAAHSEEDIAASVAAFGATLDLL